MNGAIINRLEELVLQLSDRSEEFLEGYAYCLEMAKIGLEKSVQYNLVMRVNELLETNCQLRKNLKEEKEANERRHALLETTIAKREGQKRQLKIFTETIQRRDEKITKLGLKIRELEDILQERKKTKTDRKSDHRLRMLDKIEEKMGRDFIVSIHQEIKNETQNEVQQAQAAV
jgi:hypothetical protein